MRERGVAATEATFALLDQALVFGGHHRSGDTSFVELGSVRSM
jgi:hypothetical protein